MDNITSLVHLDGAFLDQFIVSLALKDTCNDLQGFYERSVSVVFL